MGGDERIQHGDGVGKAVFFLTPEPDLIRDAADRLLARGVRVGICSSVDELARATGPSADWVLVLDTRVLSQDQSVSDLMEALGQRPELICIAPATDLGRRLQALRAGGTCLSLAPLEVEELVERLLALSGLDGIEAFRALVVDDQPVAAAFAARVLEGAGMQTRVVGDALLVLDALQGFRPDLVVMDLHMPGANGMELTSLIRAQDELYDIPIVFLSCELDPAVQMDALRVGGNDFLVKPVRPERLIGVVRDRVLAARARRGRRERLSVPDPLASGIQVRRGVAQARSSPSDQGAGPREEQAIGALRDAGSASWPPSLSRRGAGDREPAGRDVQPNAGVARRIPETSAGTVAGGEAGLCRSLEEALSSGGLELLYQPVLALRRAAGERYEALLGLRNAEGGYAAVRDLAPATGRQGLTGRIDRWVLERGLDAIQAGRGSHPGLRLVIPQSLGTIGGEGWAEWLRDRVLARDLLRHRPILQVRLAELAAHRASIAARFAELRRLGILVCIDQPEEEILDTSLVEDLQISFLRLAYRAAEAMGAAELKGSAQRLRDLGCALIVAGIETPRALLQVWQSGADFVQGAFLQAPALEMAFDFSESVLD